MEMEAIRRLRIEATTTGVAEATNQMNQLGRAHAGIAQVSEQTSRAFLAQDRALEGSIRKYDEAYRATKALEKATADFNRGLNAGRFGEGNAGVAEHARLIGLATAEYEKSIASMQRAGPVANAFAKATSGISGQMIALSAGAGPVGVFLSALGPWGLAGAVGLGALGAAFRYVEQESARMGDKSIALRQFSEATGLTAAQMSGIKHVGAEFGVTSDTLATNFERLTFGLNDARQATGTLFEQVREVNGGLADQLTQTVTTAQGIDVLANAYRSAGSEAQKMAIARAVFGRGGSASGPVLGAIADAGGIAHLHATTEATDEQTKAWARMRAETEEFEKKAKNILASIFTQEGLEAAHKAAELTLQVAKATKELATATGSVSFGQMFSNFGNLQEGGMSAADTTKFMTENAARQRLVEGKGSNLGVDSKDIQSWHQLEDAMNGVVPQMEQVSKSYLQVQQAAQAASNIERERLGLLADAATTDEKRVAKLTELTAAFLKNKISAEDYNRAVNQVNYDTGEKALAALQRQLTVLQAMPGEARALATEQARIKELLDQHESAERAIAIAAAERVNAQAQAVSGIREQVQALQDQLPIIRALTEEDKIRAEVALTYNKALREAGLPSGRGKIIDTQQFFTPQGQSQQAAGLAASDLAAQTQKNLLAQQFVQYTREAEAAEQQLVQQEKAGADQIAHANAGAKQQLVTLQEQYDSAAAVTGVEKMQADAQSTYNKLLRDGVDQITAEAVAWQQVANASAAADASVIKQTQSLQDQVELSKARKTGTEAEVAAEQALNKALAEGASLYNAEALAEATRDSIKAQKSSGGSGGGGSGGHDTGLYSLDPAEDARIRVQKNFPNLFENRTLSAPDSSGHVSVANQPAAPVLNTFGTPAQKDFAVEKWFAEFADEFNKSALERQAKAINDQVDATKKQADAANKNTDALGNVTSALSDFYNSDPRFTHLGYRPESGILDVAKLPAIPPGGAPSIVPGAAGGGGGGASPGQAPGITNPPLGATGGGSGAPPGVSGGQPGQVWVSAGISGYWGTPEQAAMARQFPTFADGGVMTDRGPVPLRRYAMGGIASSPQMAMYGEGSRPEAYVPLPDGRSIPAVVKLSQPAGRAVTINHAPTIVVNGAVDQEAIQKIRYSLFQSSQDVARSLRGHR